MTKASFILNCNASLPHKGKYVHFRSHAEYSLLPWKIPEEISRWSMLFHNYTQHLLSNILYVHTTLKHGSELTRNLMFNESIDLLCFMFAQTVFLLCGGRAALLITSTIICCNSMQCTTPQVKIKAVLQCIMIQVSISLVVTLHLRPLRSTDQACVEPR